MNELEARLLAAHADDDRAALVRLYTEAADQAADEDAAAFYLTHAYVYALELGAPQVGALQHRLIDMGREAPLQAVSDSSR
ncbi:hypothetical protein [Roseobacter sp.]|uniref:hypothetical protein n=1 Tax=Roseobacter sp. TaxID=1907202 RepID=UPI0029662E5D|nr:hypothetical protein [Roseobacter sp.]MDW3184015.1 hypothetical protein [Roseobacter sp.]